MISIYQPYLPKKSMRYAHDALNSGWISNLGEYKELAKNKLNTILNCNACVLTSNGTTSTHLLFKALKLKRPNIKNILVPCNVYAAAWNSALFDGDNWNLIPIKTSINTWNMDLQDLRQQLVHMNPEDTAVLIVHNLGGIINVPLLKREFPHFEFLEDNCEGFLGKYENKYSGTDGSLASSISFYGNKTITCGEGGAIILNDLSLLEQIEKIHSQGQTKSRYIHDILGYNFRMTNVQAAILYGQLQIFNKIIDKKTKLFNLYKKNLRTNKNIIFQHVEENCQNAVWMFSIRIKNNLNYLTAKNFFDKKGIETRNMFYPMSYHKHLKCFSNKNKEEEALQLLNEIIIFPSSPTLKISEINYISTEILNYCKLYGLNNE
jgi:perosamine synthetase